MMRRRTTPEATRTAAGLAGLSDRRLKAAIHALFKCRVPTGARDALHQPEVLLEDGYSRLPYATKHTIALILIELIEGFAGTATEWTESEQERILLFADPGLTAAAELRETAIAALQALRRHRPMAGTPRLGAALLQALNALDHRFDAAELRREAARLGPHATGPVFEGLCKVDLAQAVEWLATNAPRDVGEQVLLHALPWLHSRWDGDGASLNSALGGAIHTWDASPAVQFALRQLGVDPRARPVPTPLEAMDAVLSALDSPTPDAVGALWDRAAADRLPATALAALEASIEMLFRCANTLPLRRPQVVENTLRIAERMPSRESLRWLLTGPIRLDAPAGFVVRAVIAAVDMARAHLSPEDVSGVLVEARPSLEAVAELRDAAIPLVDLYALCPDAPLPDSLSAALVHGAGDPATSGRIRSLCGASAARRAALLAAIHVGMDTLARGGVEPRDRTLAFALVELALEVPTPRDEPRWRTEGRTRVAALNTAMHTRNEPHRVPTHLAELIRE